MKGQTLPKHDSSLHQTSVCHPIILYLTLSIPLPAWKTCGYYSCFSPITEEQIEQWQTQEATEQKNVFPYRQSFLPLIHQQNKEKLIFPVFSDWEIWSLINGQKRAESWQINDPYFLWDKWKRAYQLEWDIQHSGCGQPFLPPHQLSTGTLVVTAAAWPSFDWLSKATLSQELVH